MKTMKKLIALGLCLAMAFSLCPAAFAAEVSEQWEDMWQENSPELLAAVTMFVGSDENDRYIAWYSAEENGKVLLTKGGKTKEIAAESKASPDKGYRLGVCLENLEAGEYEYKCVSGDFVSESYSFTVKVDDGVTTALYVSDIHMAIEETNDKALMERSYVYNKTLEAAAGKADIDVVVSGGDQASLGITEEFVALSTPAVTKSVPFAVSVGNHDRKSVGYKDYTYLPNEFEMTFRSYIGTDYWFRQGDALFLMFDSCNTSMSGHYRFAKAATRLNEDATWIVAVMHHDMFGGREPWLYSENTLLRLLWTPLFDQFGVDVCLYGHSHYYSVSDVIYRNKSVTSLEGVSEITDPEGTVYLATGSVNNLAPMLDDEGNVPPIGENVAFTYLQQDSMYNLLRFTDSSLTISSYTVDSDENFYNLTIEKTDKQGGHKYRNTSILPRPLVYFITLIVNIINNSDMYNRYKEQGYDVTPRQGLIGS